MAKYNKIHFIGIGGIGVSGLAEYFLQSGCSVSGSDMTETHITKRLTTLGAEITIGHTPANITEGTDVVVYSSAIKESNPELVRAHEIGIETVRRAEMLGEIVNDKFLIAVAGTHGKTTTTAMIGKLLIDAGFDPMIFVGGNVELFEGGASRIGRGNYAVVEADEYDRSFLTLKPDIAVITNVDEDHLDIYRDLEDIQTAFTEFCKNSKAGAKLVYCGDDVNIISFTDELNMAELSYGFHFNSTFRISEYGVKENDVVFSIAQNGNTFADISLNMAGRHNVLNASAAFAVSQAMEIPFEVYKKSIGEFQTVARRLELKYNEHGLRVYDDYAHHPREIEQSLKGLKELSPNGRLIAVFQPHLYSRTRDFHKDFAQKLATADKIILMDIYPARELPIEGVSSELIFDELKRINNSSSYVKSGEEILAILLSDLRDDDTIVFQGAGDITGLCERFVNQLKVNQNLQVKSH